MAIMKFLFAASALASLTSAVPMPEGVGKRAVLINTVTHTTWTTVDVTTTVYVNDADPTPVADTANSPVASVPSPAPVSSTPTPAPSPANFVAEQQASPPPAAYTPPASSAAPAPPAPPASTAVNPVPKAAGGPCEGQGSGCSGDVTYYNGAGGYGACGGLIDDSAFTIALPHGLMGTQSNGNPYCGRSVTIKGTDGSTHTGTVQDKCMGCEGYSIDLTPALFKVVAPAGDGRVAGIEWWFS